MANNVALSVLRDKIRERGEIQAVYTDDPALTDWINEGIKDLYDQILSVNQDFLVTISSNISIVSGTQSYSLPADFAHLVGVDVLYQGSSDWRSLKQANLSERHYYNTVPTKLYWKYRVLDASLYIFPTPSESGTVRLWYIPVPTALSADSDTYDFVFGWDEYVILDCLEKHAMKEESDHMPFLQKKMAVLERILARAKQRNYAEPNTIRNADLEAFYARYPWVKT